MRALVFIAAAVVLGTAAETSVDTAWVRMYDGPAVRDDYVRDVAIDSVGNVFVIGQSDNETQPGEINDDILLIKYSPGGEVLWTDRYDGPRHEADVPRGLGFYPDGSVYVTGASCSDIVTIKYDADGNRQWVRSFNGPGGADDFPADLAVADDGNVYVGGSSEGPNGYDYVVVKYRPDGDTAWARYYDGPAHGRDYAVSTELDPEGNVMIAGHSTGDFSDEDVAVVKYDSAGLLQWVTRYDAPNHLSERVADMAVDEAGFIAVTGEQATWPSLKTFLTLMLAPGGDTLWVRTYEGLGGAPDRAEAVVFGADGAVYVAGSSDRASENADYATLCYERDGATRWCIRYDGPAQDYDQAHDLTDLGSEMVAVTGGSWSATGSGFDCLTVAYDLDGGQVWEHRYNGPRNSVDVGIALAALSDSLLVSTGDGVGGGTDFQTIRYSGLGGLAAPTLRGFVAQALTATPSPVQANARVVIRASSGSHREFVVRSPDGRVVASVPVMRGGGRTTAVWNLTDTSGRRVRAGVYLIEGVGGGLSLRTKVVVVE